MTDFTIFCEIGEEEERVTPALLIPLEMYAQEIGFFDHLRHLHLDMKAVKHTVRDKGVTQILNIAIGSAYNKDIDTELRPDRQAANAVGQEQFPDQSGINRFLRRFTPVEIDDLADLPSQGFLIEEFHRIWVEVGMFPNNHMITTEEGQELADYVLAGGQLYISGGDTFCFDPDTPIQDLVGFDSCGDGGGSVGDISAIISASCGQNNFDQVVPYDGEAAYVDQLQPVTTGEEILFASEGFTCAVINYVGQGGAVISQSPEMGGIGSNHDRKELIERYISCLPFEPPMAQFSFDPAAGPAPLTVQFTGQSTGIIDDFLWQFGDAQESPSTSPQHVYSEAGSYTVTLTVTGPGGVDAMTVVDAIVVGEALPGFIRERFGKSL